MNDQTRQHLTPERMWQRGQDELIGSSDLPAATTAERAREEYVAALWFASSQARSLATIAEQLPALVEQQRIANIIAALGTDAEDGLIAIEDQAAAEVYVRAHIGGLVNPDPNGHT